MNEADKNLGSERPAAPADAENGAENAPGSDGGGQQGATPTELDAARAETARMKDQLLRTAADYDNFRKRSRREAEDAQKRGKEEFLRELLPVFDNLERAALHAGQANDAKAVADGVRMVLKQFADTLGKMDIRRIETTGTPFNPAHHEAIQQIESREHPPGTIVAEVQPGYTLGDRLVRAAMVVVAKPPENDGEPAPAPEPN